MTYDIFPEKIPDFIVKIAQCLPLTLLIMLASLAIALLLGVVVAYAQLCGRRVPAACARGWIAFMRGIPTLVMIFLLFFALPQLLRALFGINIADADKSYFVVASLALVASADMGEMIRSSYLAVPREQAEAALACGMKPWQAMLRIVLPQAIAIALPLFGNNTVALFKQTSLAFSIGVIDLMGRANVIAAANYGAYKLELYVAVAIIYWVVCVILQLVFDGLERVATRGRRVARA